MSHKPDARPCLQIILNHSESRLPTEGKSRTEANSLFIAVTVFNVDKARVEESHTGGGKTANAARRRSSYRGLSEGPSH